MAILMRYRTGEIAEVLRWSQTVIDWADGDPTKGNLIVGSPLAVALVWRGTARFWLGRDGWRQDLDDAAAMARSIDPATHAWSSHGSTVGDHERGARRRRHCVARAEEALKVAERIRRRYRPRPIKYIAGYRAGARDGAADRQRGVELLEQVRDMCLHERRYRSECRASSFMPPREGHARRPRWRHTGDAQGRRRFLDAGQLAYGPAGTAFWWRHCWSAAPRMTWPKPRARSTVRRICWPTRVWCCANLAAAAARPGGPGPRRRGRLSGIGGALPRDGHLAWLRGPHRDGRGDDRGWGAFPDSTRPLEIGHAHTRHAVTVSPATGQYRRRLSAAIRFPEAACQRHRGLPRPPRYSLARLDSARCDLPQSPVASSSLRRCAVLMPSGTW